MVDLEITLHPLVRKAHASRCAGVFSVAPRMREIAELCPESQNTMHSRDFGDIAGFGSRKGKWLNGEICKSVEFLENGRLRVQLYEAEQGLGEFVSVAEQSIEKIDFQ